MEERKLNRNHLGAIHAEARAEMRALGRDLRIRGFRCPVTSESLDPDTAQLVTAKGLGKLVNEGVQEFKKKTGHYLPHNLVFTQMSGALSFGSAPMRYGALWCSPEGADRLLREYGRYRGWLRAAADLPAVKKALMKGQSGRGVNSDYTYFSLGCLIKKWPSPHRLERALWKARKRADEMLAAWPGERRWTSWAQLAVGLIETGRPGKAAVMAASAALFGGTPHSYRRARDTLVRMRSANFPVLDASDGVVAQREAEPVWRRLGISVSRIRVAEGNLFSLQFLVRHEASGRTYHANLWQEDRPKDAVKAALRAWSEQDRIATQEADLVGFLRGDQGYCPMVVREHSYRAGNCHAGTESWVRQHGLTNRDWIPGQFLVPHLGDEMVRRVAYACRESFIGATEE